MSQSPIVLLTTALIIGLYDYPMKEISTLDSFLKVDHHSFVCTSYNGPQHKVSTKNSTSILYNTTQLQGHVLNTIPKLGTVSLLIVPN